MHNSVSLMNLFSVSRATYNNGLESLSPSFITIFACRLLARGVGVTGFACGLNCHFVICNWSVQQMAKEEKVEIVCLIGNHCRIPMALLPLTISLELIITVKVWISLVMFWCCLGSTHTSLQMNTMSPALPAGQYNHTHY